MENKCFKKICPKCANVYIDCEIAKVSLGKGVQLNLMCEQGHKWSEFYNLSYKGYWWDGKKYNNCGEVENV
ncbi:MAG: hypothetical protein IJY81_06720 [Lachnospiraceae bacterium]|nr:hypothetical protein [Lachnospiraceae bacterium]